MALDREGLLSEEARALDVEAALGRYRAEGWAPLGRLLTDAALAELQTAADDLLLGRVRYPEMFFQLDSPTGRYDDVVFRTGFQGGRLDYRKVEKLELEPRFRALIANRLFERLARAWYGGEVSLFRAVLWVKAPSGGTELPWHQDGGRFWGLDRDPSFQTWVALDDAPLESGCVEVVPRSHLGGLVTPNGGQLADEVLAAADADARALALPVRAGDALLLHNHTWHRSGMNRSGQIRRAVGICYMDAATRCTRKKHAPRQFLRPFS